MPAIAMSPILSPRRCSRTTGSSPIIWPSCATRRKAPATSQATPRTVLYRQSDIEDWLTANTVGTEDSKEMKKHPPPRMPRSNERRFK